MATVSAQVPDATPAKRTVRILVRETWASLAIAVIWLVVLFDALLDQDLVTSNAGANFTRIPSAIFVAFFAYLATRVVAKHGLGANRSDSDGDRRG
jgi:hypothetical protein